MTSPRRRAVDAYAVLGAARTASWNELRRSYRARARELHPDVQAHRPTPSRLDQPRATALFTQLQEAWSLVATPERRAAYDLTLRAEPAGRARRPPRPTFAPSWSVGPRAGVLLRTGPGDLHIAIPGGAWDLSLAAFLRHASEAGLPPLLIGDLPPYAALRQALSAADFVERHRLTTMVGLSEPVEDRGGAEFELDDDGAWKLKQLDRALERWAKALPDRRDELPYQADLRLMGRLSLAGYEINLPHPAGIYAALEPRPVDRAELRARSLQPVLDVRIPPPALALAAAWAEDRLAISAMEEGWSGLAALAKLEESALVAAQRASEGRRPRRDGYEPLPGSALDSGPPPASLMPVIGAIPATAHWLAGLTGPLPRLPWREPLSLSGEDRSLGDAGTRLLARVLDRLLTDRPPGVWLTALRGTRLRFRVESDPERIEDWIQASIRGAFAEHLGFPIAATVAKG